MNKALFGRFVGPRCAVFALLGWFACGGPDPSTRATPARYLDDVCSADACTTSGSATRSTGGTSDTIGYRIGPGPGELRTHLTNLPRFFASGRQASWSVAVLVSGRGSLYATACPATGCSGSGARPRWAAPDGYTWIEVTGGDVGLAGDGAAIEATPPTEVVLQIGVEDDSVVDVLDMRFAESIPADPGCE